jgi:hypothetical protein
MQHLYRIYLSWLTIAFPSLLHCKFICLHLRLIILASHFGKKNYTQLHQSVYAQLLIKHHHEKAIVYLVFTAELA